MKPPQGDPNLNKIDARYAGRRRTILVGNCTIAQARQVLGASVWSRMTEVGGAVVCDWESFRTGRR